MIPTKLIALLVCLSVGESVKILGLFSNTDGDGVETWIHDAADMFRIAFQLADKFGIRVLGEKIDSDTHVFNDDVNGFNEMDALCQRLINSKESDIIGVVGATSSSSARFVASLAGHVGLPLITYAATSPELSNRQVYPTLYRIAPSDELLAAAIVKLFEHFNWTTCMLILSNDDYSYDGVRILRERYQQKLLIIDQILFNTHTHTFSVNLTQILNRSLSRIVLVWARRNSTSHIIRQAVDQGLFSGDFVWITTNQVNEKSFADLHRLRGLLSVAAVVSDEGDMEINLTLRDAVCKHWNKVKISCPETMHRIYPYAAYTFDAAWTLIQALSKLKNDHPLPRLNQSSCCFNQTLTNKDQYIAQLDSISYLGLTGHVQFSSGNARDRINGTSYALYDLQSDSSEPTMEWRRLMLWNSSSSQWQKSVCHGAHTRCHKHSILSQHVPDYYDLYGITLRILVHVAPPFIIRDECRDRCRNKHRLSLPTNNGTEEIYGFLVDFLVALQNKLGLTYIIDIADVNTSYHDLVSKVAGDNPDYDLVMSAIRITSNRLNYVDFSTPIFEHYLRIITRKDMATRPLDFWSAFMLFDWVVWSAIFGSIVYSGVLIYIFERDHLTLHHRPTWMPKVVVGTVRVITSVLVMNGDVPLRRNSSRLITLGLYGLGVILMAMYTANLSSFLTLSRAQPIISSIDDIKNGLISLDRIGVVSNSAVSDYFEKFISNSCHPLASPDDIYPLLLNRSIDVAVWTAPVLQYAVDNYYCTQLMVSGLGFVKSSFAFVIPKGWKYKCHLDLEILRMRESEQFEQFEKKWFSPRKCIGSLYADDGSSSWNIEALPIDLMVGIFIVFFLFSLFSLFIYTWDSRVYQLKPT